MSAFEGRCSNSREFLVCCQILSLFIADISNYRDVELPRYIARPDILVVRHGDLAFAACWLSCAGGGLSALLGVMFAHVVIGGHERLVGGCHRLSLRESCGFGKASLGTADLARPVSLLVALLLAVELESEIVV